MNDQHDGGSGRRSDAPDNAGWPETPDQLVYHLDAVVEVFERVQQGQPIDLLDALLDCVDWREMFGSEASGFLQREQIDELRRYYRAKFADIEPFYLAEQLSTEFMTALMSSGEIAFSEDLKRLGRERPDLWREIRTFFSRKEVVTSLLMLANRRGDAQEQR